MVSLLPLHFFSFPFSYSVPCFSQGLGFGSTEACNLFHFAPGTLILASYVQLIKLK